MSYDLEVWTAKPVALPDMLPQPGRWARDGIGFARGGRGWQVRVVEPDRVLPEDVGGPVARALPGIRFLVRLHLEPIQAPKAARSLLGRAARALARAAHGVVVDPQAATVETPAGVHRFRPQRRPARFALLELGWWFTESPLLHARGREQLVDLIEAHLPEAMPKRYGDYEPPQHVFAETGREHFLAFLHERVGTDNRLPIFVWYPHRPVLDVSVYCRPTWGVDRDDWFRVNSFDVSVERTVLAQPGWLEGLRGFFHAVSEFLQPFFGEVRTVRGYVPMGATYGSDMETEIHPLGGSWRGLPATLGHAAVLGPPYRGQWPAYEKAAACSRDLAFLDGGQWEEDDDVAAALGACPPGWSSRGRRRTRTTTAAASGSRTASARSARGCFRWMGPNSAGRP